MEKKKGGRRRNQNLMSQCALAVASGASIGRWARENKVPERTAYGWSMLPEFKTLVASNRQTIVSRAVGVLVKHSTAAARELARLVKNGESDSIRLAAARTLIDQVIALGNHAEAARVLAEMQTRINQIEASLPQDNKKTEGK